MAVFEYFSVAARMFTPKTSSEKDLNALIGKDEFSIVVRARMRVPYTAVRGAFETKACGFVLRKTNDDCTNVWAKVGPGGVNHSLVLCGTYYVKLLFNSDYDELFL